MNPGKIPREKCRREQDVRMVTGKTYHISGLTTPISIFCIKLIELIVNDFKLHLSKIKIRSKKVELIQGAKSSLQHRRSEEETETK